MRGHYFIFLFIALTIGSCREKQEATNTGSLDVLAFENALNHPSEKIILDVRTPEEFMEGHIENALLINFHDEDFTSRVNQLDKQVPVYVYCASGVRSDKAATILKTQGFDKVHVLKEGLNEWRSANKKLVR